MNKLHTVTISLLIIAGSQVIGDVAAAQQATTVDRGRVTRSADGFEVMRGNAETRDRSTFVEQSAIPRTRHSAATKGDASVAALVAQEAWIYDASVELFDDFDGDGYFTFVRVRFDADSIYADHYVYARLFVTTDGINWDEYHATNDFLIDGTSDFDDYEVETELVTGFETNLYDILIELYDADLGHFLAEFGPADSSEFSLIPLEDIDRDTVQPIVIVTEHGGGGSANLASILALMLAAGTMLIARRHRRRQLQRHSSAQQQQALRY